MAEELRTTTVKVCEPCTCPENTEWWNCNCGALILAEWKVVSYGGRVARNDVDYIRAHYSEPVDLIHGPILD